MWQKKSIYKIGSEEQMKMKLDFKSHSFEQQLGDVEGKRKEYLSIFYKTVIWRPESLHLKVRKIATKIVCLKTACKTLHTVFFRVPIGKFYVWQKSFTQPVVVKKSNMADYFAYLITEIILCMVYQYLFQKGSNQLNNTRIG